MTEDKKQLDKDTIDKFREMGESSLFFFARAILGFEDFDKNIHKPACDELQDPKNTRVLVVFPRVWFKSTMGAIAYAIWEGIKNPNIRILIVQNSYANACKKLQSIKQIFEKNKLLRALWPHVLPGKNSIWSRECLTLTRTAAHPEGTFEAAGTGTAVISRHFDIIIEDDTVAPEKDALTGLMQVPTQFEIEKAIGWHRVAYPLLLHPIKSKRVVIGTRWAERDLIGWILENCPEFKLISRAARENDKGEGDLNGHIIWDRYNDEVLAQLERSMGPYMFQTLYMNMPIASINQVFKREWIQYFTDLPIQRGDSGICCTSVDPAASDSDSSSDPDYNTVVTTKVYPKSGMIYVVDAHKERMNPGQLIGEILRQQAIWDSVVVKIEAIAYQRTLNYWLKKKQEKLNRYFYVEEIKSHGKTSKEDRIRAMQPFFSNGLIYLSINCQDVERELLSFPNGAHDDLIDALCMQVGFWADETRVRRIDKERNNLLDPFSGASLIAECMGLANQSHGYPFDIGLMSERLSPRRQYEYEGTYR
ncbi:hypothetical protein LCGC14_1546930 [marine sediment metagenome]|uniref:Terminase large subunit gp17-like C-terminal domain-containing protein n=1 Tax=marine sediment metagenome TaxID=412755 RepID=A0A0F9JCB8_9ZZZZ